MRIEPELQDISPFLLTLGLVMMAMVLVIFVKSLPAGARGCTRLRCLMRDRLEAARKWLPFLLPPYTLNASLSAFS